jgi:hypothetical protein
MKVYLSSTYDDLREHRVAADLALRRMGHDVIGMEQYVAEGMTPLERVRADVRVADAYLVLIGWRYGYVPVDATNPSRRSITELEFEKAIEPPAKPVLAFLLDPQAPWPPSAIDALATTGGKEIAEFRARLGGGYLAGVFTTPDNLASQVAAAVARLGTNRHLAERALGEAPIGGGMAMFARGNPMDDSTLGAIRGMVTDAEGVRWVPIRMRQGEWWSTRLYLLAALLDTLTPVRQIVFTHADGSFAGMATPAAVRAGLCAAFPEIAQFDATLRSGVPTSRDVERETDRWLGLWGAQMAQARESAVKVSVRWQLVREWLGERLIRRCIRLEPEDGLTMVQVQQIVDSLIGDVPLERPPRTPSPQTVEPEEAEIMVVDRDAFALELAREWVRTGLPRPTRV